jgi:hypothetical protein
MELEKQMLAAARFDSLEQLQSWVNGRPSTQELQEIPLASQALSSEVSKAEKMREEAQSPSTTSLVDAEIRDPKP